MQIKRCRPALRDTTRGMKNRRNSENSVLSLHLTQNTACTTGPWAGPHISSDSAWAAASRSRRRGPGPCRRIRVVPPQIDRVPAAAAARRRDACSRQLRRAGGRPGAGAAQGAADRPAAVRARAGTNNGDECPSPARVRICIVCHFDVIPHESGSGIRV